MNNIFSILSALTSIESEVNAQAPAERIQTAERIISTLESIELVSGLISDFHTEERENIMTTIETLDEVGLTNEQLNYLANRMKTIENEIEAQAMSALSGRLSGLRDLLGLNQQPESNLGPIASLLSSLAR